jgi:hypothetical protein
LLSAYRGSQNGEGTGSSTHYAALIGEKAAFRRRGLKIAIANGAASGELL